MTIYWRIENLNETIEPIVRPSSYPLDIYMAIGKLDATDYTTISKCIVPSFKIHDNQSLKQFLGNINNKLGRPVYVSTDELLQLGITLNIETGYLLYINSTSNIMNNFRFSLTTNVNTILKKIIEACNSKTVSIANISQIKRSIKTLYSDNNIKLELSRYRPHFPIEYNTQIEANITSFSLRNKLGDLKVYAEPDPLIPIFSSYQCDFCLKSFADIKLVQRHLLKFHTLPTELCSTDFISPSYSQNTPSGLLTVLVSRDFLNLENKILETYKSDIPNYSIPEALPTNRFNGKKKEIGYTINDISEFDEIFDFNYFTKFIDNLKPVDFNYYLDYCKMNDTYRKMDEFLTKILFNIIVVETKKYKYDSNLKTHSEKILKFYSSFQPSPSFSFNQLVNPKHILNYSKFISKSLLILFASYNLSKQKLNVYCQIPEYKVSFTHSQKKLLNKLFNFILQNYDKTDIVMFSEEEITNTNSTLRLSKKYSKFWKTLSGFLIDITLQQSSKKSPLQTIFCFSTCFYEFIHKRLNFYMPPKRSKIFKALLYIIRLSFLTKICKYNDENYYALIKEATMTGELRKIMEKLYYPTLYYFLERKTTSFSPFFNSKDLTYVHPVLLKDKFVGCKLLGLFSINMMLKKTTDYLQKECKCIEKFFYLQFDGCDNQVGSMKTDNSGTKHTCHPKRSLYYIENDITEFKRSVAGITCFLIGYLILTFKPFTTFNEYLRIPKEAFEFSDDVITLRTDQYEFTIKDQRVLNFFRYYLLIRKQLINADASIDDIFFFLNLTYVRSSTLLDLIGVRYTSYSNLSSYLRKCHDKLIVKQEKVALDWINLIKTAKRKKCEGYLIFDLKSVIPKDDKYASIREKSPEPDSYISLEKDYDLKDIINFGFLDSQFSEDEEKELLQIEKPDLKSFRQIEVTSEKEEELEEMDSLDEKEYKHMLQKIKYEHEENPFKRKKL